MENTISTVSFAWFSLAFLMVGTLIGGAINNYLHASEDRKNRAKEQAEKVQQLGWKMNDMEAHLDRLHRRIEFMNAALKPTCTPCEKKK